MRAGARTGTFFLPLLLLGCASVPAAPSRLPRHVTVDQLMGFLTNHYPDLRDYTDLNKPAPGFYNWNVEVCMFLRDYLREWEYWEKNSTTMNQKWRLPNGDYIFWHYSVDHWQLECDVATGSEIPDQRTKAVFLLDGHDGLAWLRTNGTWQDRDTRYLPDIR